MCLDCSTLVIKGEKMSERKVCPEWVGGKESVGQTDEYEAGN